jgi:hypothetical protein
MAEAHYDNLNELLEGLESKSVAEIAHLMKQYSGAFDYQGFDPVHVMNLIHTTCATLKFSERKMIVIAIGTLVNRGTKVAKIRGKSLDEYKSALDNLMRLLTKKTGTNLDKNDITLPRIAACYPELTARYVCKLQKPILPGYEGIHPLLTSHCFAAVCPSSADYLEHAKINVLWNIEFDRLVRPKDPTPPTKTIMFWKAAHASVIMNDDDRKKLMSELNLSPPSSEWRNANQGKLAAIPSVEMAAPVKTPSVIGPAFAVSSAASVSSASSVSSSPLSPTPRAQSIISHGSQQSYSQQQHGKRR